MAQKTIANEETATAGFAALSSPNPWTRVEAVGRPIYGPAFMTKLAPVLGYRRQTLYNWKSRPETIPDDIDTKLLGVILAAEDAHLIATRARTQLLARLKQEVARNVARAKAKK